jgi:hypothetical protein
MPPTRLLTAGFIHCDNEGDGPAIRLFDLAVEGIHKVFSSKKLRKDAQAENPLVCKGFKKKVALIVSC